MFDMPDSTVDDKESARTRTPMPNNRDCGTEPKSGKKESTLAPRNLLYLLAVTTTLFVVSASQGAAQYHEAPMLAEMVARGDLPPVNERLPDNPSMLDAPELESGEYGGTARVVAGSMNDLIAEPYVGRYILQFSAEGRVTGDIAEDFKLSDDKRLLTIHLRPGLRWSDGAPFTADDIIFRFEDMHWVEEVQTLNPYPDVKRVIKVDDHTLMLESEQPNPGIVLKMATWRGGNWTVFAPKHYLSQWHIRYNDDAMAKAREEGFESWEKAMSAHEGYPYNLPTDVDKPTLDPWRPVDLNPDLVWKRNPYYARVDAAGKQLPYIDQVLAERVQDQDPELLSVKIMQGEVDIAYSRLRLDHFGVLKEHEDTGDYSVTLIRRLESASVGVALNLNHPEDRRAELYQDARFRYALSLAIDRNQVNEYVYYGLAVPRQSAPVPNPTYYKAEWEQAYASYDPERANALLDEIGMTTRDPDGVRFAPWGEPLKIVIEFPEHLFHGYEVLDMIKHYWNALGIDVSLSPLAPHIFNSRHNRQPRTTEQEKPVNQHDAVAMAVVGDSIEMFLRGASYHSCFRSKMHAQALLGDCGASFDWGSAWGDWIAAHNANLGGTMPGRQPPPEVITLDAWTREWVKTLYASDRHVELAHNIFDLQAEKLWIIGVVGLAPHPIIAKNNVGNVPTTYAPGSSGQRSLAYSSEQLYFR